MLTPNDATGEAVTLNWERIESVIYGYGAQVLEAEMKISPGSSHQDVFVFKTKKINDNPNIQGIKEWLGSGQGILKVEAVMKPNGKIWFEVYSVDQKQFRVAKTSNPKWLSLKSQIIPKTAGSKDDLESDPAHRISDTAFEIMSKLESNKPDNTSNLSEPDLFRFSTTQ